MKKQYNTFIQLLEILMVLIFFTSLPCLTDGQTKRKLEPGSKKKFIRVKKIPEVIQEKELFQQVDARVQSPDKLMTILEDEKFYGSLKSWVEECQDYFIEYNLSEDEAKSEAVALINKFIFIRSLEDFGTLPFNYLRKEVREYIDRWGRKEGAKRLSRDINDWMIQNLLLKMNYLGFGY